MTPCYGRDTMSLTLQELEQRLVLLEEEMGRLRQKVEEPVADRAAGREGRTSRDGPGMTAEQLWHEMGNTGSPPTMAELRATAEQNRQQANREKAQAANGRTARRKSRSKKGE